MISIVTQHAEFSSQDQAVSERLGQRYWLAQQNKKEHNQGNQDKRRTEQEDKEPNNKEKTETRHRTLRASSFEDKVGSASL